MAKCYERELKSLQDTFKNILRKRQRTKELQRLQILITDKLNQRIVSAEYL